MRRGTGRRAMAYAAVVVGLALSGCSSGGGESADESAAPTVTQTVTETASPTETSTSPTTQTPSGSITPTAGAPAVDGPVVAQDQLSSPSGNIWCSLEYGIECEVKESSYQPLPKPADCRLDWADNQFRVDRSTGARGICRGDVTFTEQPPELTYGTTSVVGDRACQSTETAMTCWDTGSGHGFRVSRDDYQLF
ncbi:hypothetical protein SAMN04489844_2646 [Nocardioides exalbidus]|uniref:Uncharacterized protein n=1 Tax=Nocardioides exalbidus TaxID=402596 RepID=A0A1H4U0A4_9ACTN|nr:DUF6636 domain-containing protein [Nocardioides exalbidus]SEC62139.1 hypothetical protein SAMN04489844_2646 [Nocardioides exalbidus]